MSLHSRSRLGLGRPPESSAYRGRFLRDVYCLIARGYEGLTPGSLVDKDETAITGLLVEAIESFLNDPLSPDWTGRYTIREEKPIHAAKKEGKARSRVDIEIESLGRRPRPQFQFEAKRLRAAVSRSLASYLGRDGLGCFLSGRYAASHGQAGMIGFVQSGSEPDWAHWIHERLNREAKRYQMASGSGGLRPHHLVPEIEHSYLSRHVRPADDAIEVHHVLLLCHDES